MKKAFLVLAALLLAIVTCPAQTPAIDSLENVLAIMPVSDTGRAALLNRLATACKGIAPEKSIAYARQALHLANNLQIETEKPKALRTMGSYHYQRGVYDSALHYFEQAAAFATKVGDAETLAWAKNGKGTVFHSQSNYPKALEYYQQAVDIFAKSGKEKEAASIMGNAGVLYKELGDLPHALESFKQGLLLQQKKGDKSEMARFLNNIGNIYSDQKTFSEAEKSYRQGLVLAIKEKNPRMEALILRNMVDIEQQKGQVSKAFEAARRSVQLYRSMGDMEGVADAGYRLAMLHLTSNNPDSAIYYGAKALQTAENIGFKRNLYDTYDVLSKAYAAKGDYRSAYAAQQQYLLYRDSLAGEKQKNLVAGIRFQYDLDKKQNEIELLKSEKALQAAKVHAQRIRLYSLLGLLLLVGVVAALLVRSNRRKHKANQLLAEQKEAINQTYLELQATQAQLVQREKMASLGELTAGIAHEIQNPLNFVNNFSEVSVELAEEIQHEVAEGRLQQVQALVTDMADNLKKVSFHGRRADSIVKAMLQHSRQTGGTIETGDLNTLADEYVRLCYHGLRARDKGFNTELHTRFAPHLPLVKMVSQDVGRVILNLVNNAFYAVNEKKKQLGDGYQPAVWITTSAQQKGQGQMVQLDIKDNGTGIPANIQHKIFQPFFTTKPTGLGTGLGLSLSYDIVKAHGGQVTMESSEGEGTTFTVTLPAQLKREA